MAVITRTWNKSLIGKVGVRWCHKNAFCFVFSEQELANIQTEDLQDRQRRAPAEFLQVRYALPVLPAEHITAVRRAGRTMFSADSGFSFVVGYFPKCFSNKLSLHLGCEMLMWLAIFLKKLFCVMKISG